MAVERAALRTLGCLLAFYFQSVEIFISSVKTVHGFRETQEFQACCSLKSPAVMTQ
jgi:hypothetical protein